MRFTDYLINENDGMIKVDKSIRVYSSTTSIKKSYPEIDGCILNGDLIADAAYKLKNLNGSPHTINGVFDISNNNAMKTLEGGPKIVNDDYMIYGSLKLESFKGIARYIKGVLYCNNCPNVRSIKHLWGCYIGKGINCNTPNGLEEAISIMDHYMKKDEKNYMVVVREARNHGLEDYFK